MIKRITHIPSITLIVFDFEDDMFCVVKATTPRLQLHSKALLIDRTSDWDNEQSQRLVRLRQKVSAYIVEDTSEIAQLRPSPPDNDALRTTDPLQYCRQWDDHYRANAEFAALKGKLLEHRREQRNRLLVEIELLNNKLASSKNVQQLLATPVAMNEEDRTEERFFALYRGSLWTTSRMLAPEEWKVLVDRHLEEDDARFSAALGGITEAFPRERISSEVRRAVWRRDAGRCVRCGSRERLEYDHIIPVSEGGGNTERNIELLCERCNREKADSIS